MEQNTKRLCTKQHALHQQAVLQAYKIIFHEDITEF